MVIPRHGVHLAGFKLRRIVVSNRQLMTAREIVVLSGLQVGDNLLAVDLDEVEKRVSSHPDIRSAAVSRHVPDTIKIEIAERFPVASVHKGRRYVVDGDGIFLSDRKQRGNSSLPMLVGLDFGEVRVGEKLSSPGAERVLDLVRRCCETGLARQLELVSIDVRDPDNLILRTKDIEEIRLGNGEIGQRLQLLSYILEERKKRGLNSPARYLDLRWKNVTEMPLRSGERSGRG
jgi:cell division protein FtsQ